MSTKDDKYWESDKYRNDYSHTDIVEIDETKYLVQGDLQDAITMFRPITELLECERDNVNVMLGEIE